MQSGGRIQEEAALMPVKPAPGGPEARPGPPQGPLVEVHHHLQALDAGFGLVEKQAHPRIWFVVCHCR